MKSLKQLLTCFSPKTLTSMLSKLASSLSGLPSTPTAGEMRLLKQFSISE